MDRFVSSKKDLTRPSAWLLSCLSDFLKPKARTTRGGMATHEGLSKSSGIYPPLHILSSISRSSCASHVIRQLRVSGTIDCKTTRSEERRVGKEGRSRWAQDS